MRKRPLTVTIVAWLFIATGVFANTIHLRDVVFQPTFQYEDLWIPIVAFLPAVFGVFILLGQSWARWLALGWISFHVAMSFFDSWQKVSMHAVLAVLIGYVLFCPGSRAYFHQSETA
jgi:hypothetical protein